MKTSIVIRPLGLFLAIAGPISSAQAQQGLGHSNAASHEGRIHARSIRLVELRKECVFPVVTLPRPHFTEIGYWIADLPAGFWGKGSAPCQAIMLASSHTGKNGGPVLMYEVAPRPGMTAEHLINTIANAHIFKEVPHQQGWGVRPMVVGGTVVGPSGYVPAALDDAVIALKH